MSIAAISLRAMRSGLHLSRCLESRVPQAMALSIRLMGPQAYSVANPSRGFSTSSQLANKTEAAYAMATHQPLLPGNPAPDFACKALMPDQSFADIRLSDYRGKYVVLFFYPADFTFVCPTEIVAFSDRAAEFHAANCELLACSTDTHFVHLAWTNTPRGQGGLGRLSIPLLADPSHAVSRAYGVLKADDGVAFRGMFVIDGKGALRQITVNDMPVGRSVDEALRLVQAFQFVDKHGEVCPANWKPGGKAMKPDPVGSKEYFKSV